MIQTLLSFSQHPSLKLENTLTHYLDSLYYCQHQQNRKFKHSIQALLTSLIRQGEFEFSSSIISQITKDSITNQLPTKPSSHLSSVPPKTSYLAPVSLDAPFQYIPNSLLSFKDVSYKAKADLAALIFYTLLQHSESPLSCKDIERLSQKYISLFPSLTNSSDWDSRYTSNRSRFCIFCGDLLRKATKAELVKLTSASPRLSYSLLSLGVNLADSITQSVVKYSQAS